jgi:hypothetical protein
MMPYGNLYDFEELVKGYEKRINQRVNHRQLVRAALAAQPPGSPRPPRPPFIARLGAWMVRAGTALQGRTDELIVVAAQPPAALGPEGEPC